MIQEATKNSNKYSQYLLKGIFFTRWHIKPLLFCDFIASILVNLQNEFTVFEKLIKNNKKSGSRGN